MTPKPPDTLPPSISDMGVDVAARFREILRTETMTAVAIAAMEVLMQVLEKCSARTLQELVKLINQASVQMRSVDCCVCSIMSGTELFLRFITLTSKLEEGTFEEMRSVMLTKGEIFLERMIATREKIAKLGARSLHDGAEILIHSKSKTMMATIKEAHLNNKNIHVFVTESSFSEDGNWYDMRRDLEETGIPFTVILDAAVGSVIPNVDCILVGADGVMESGGIVNKIGTYTIALCAKELNKPVYVMCESFKFIRLYPLNQRDLPDELRYYASAIRSKADLSQVNPLTDYTPPSLLTLLFTDLGILTPSAVSDELIKLYL